MKTIEYYYNIIYYFFYRGVIKVGTFITTKNPFVLLIYFYYKIPSVKQKWKEKGIDNPFKRHIDVRIKKFVENPELSLSTYYGRGFMAALVLGFYFTLYHLSLILFYPQYLDAPKNLIMWGVIMILSFITDSVLSTNKGKDVAYIKEFDKKKGFWRVKWALITALSIPFMTWLAISTSSHGAIGNYFIERYKQNSANSILYRPDESTKTIDDLIIKR